MTGSAGEHNNQSGSESTWIIDQIEAGLTTLIARDFDGDPITLPAHLLPSQVREGDIVHLRISSDPDASHQARDQIVSQIAMLAQDDDGDDFSL